MGSRTNTTLAWVTTGLVVISIPCVAYAGLEGSAWDPPPAHVSDVDAGTEPDTQPFDDVGIGTDSFIPTDDVGGVGVDATGPRLPDGGTPSPLPNPDTSNGCQCAHVTSAGATSAPGWLAVPLAALAIASRRRRRR